MSLSPHADGHQEHGGEPDVAAERGSPDRALDASNRRRGHSYSKAVVQPPSSEASSMPSTSEVLDGKPLPPPLPRAPSLFAGEVDRSGQLGAVENSRHFLSQPSLRPITLPTTTGAPLIGSEMYSRPYLSAEDLEMYFTTQPAAPAQESHRGNGTILDTFHNGRSSLRRSRASVSIEGPATVGVGRQRGKLSTTQISRASTDPEESSVRKSSSTGASDMLNLQDLRDIVSQLRREVDLLTEEGRLLQDFSEGLLLTMGTPAAGTQSDAGQGETTASPSMGREATEGGSDGAFSLSRLFSSPYSVSRNLVRFFGGSSGYGSGGDVSSPQAASDSGGPSQSSLLDGSKSGGQSQLPSESLAPSRRGLAYRRKSSYGREVLLTPEEKTLVLRLSAGLARREVHADHLRLQAMYEHLRAEREEALLRLSELRMDHLMFNRSVFLDVEEGKAVSAAVFGTFGAAPPRAMEEERTTAMGPDAALHIADSIPMRSVAAENVEKYFMQRPLQLIALKKKILRSSAQIERDIRKLMGRLSSGQRQFLASKGRTNARFTSLGSGQSGSLDIDAFDGEHSEETTRGQYAFLYYDYGSERMKSFLGPTSVYMKGGGMFLWKRISAGESASGKTREKRKNRRRNPTAGSSDQRDGLKTLGGGLRSLLLPHGSGVFADDSAESSGNDEGTATDENALGLDEDGASDGGGSDDVGGGFHQVDLEQLRIENQQLTERIEKRNQELLTLKSTSTRAVHTLNHLNDALNTLAMEHTQLKKEEKSRGETLQRVQKELALVKRQVLDAKQKLAAIKEKHEAVEVPSTEAYIAQKAELYDLEKAVSNCARKVEIQRGSVMVTQQRIRNLRSRTVEGVRVATLRTRQFLPPLSAATSQSVAAARSAKAAARRSMSDRRGRSSPGGSRMKGLAQQLTAASGAAASDESGCGFSSVIPAGISR